MAHTTLANNRKAAVEEPAALVGGRLAGLDVVRGGAMLLGIVLHAAISYMPGRMPGLYWGVYDEANHPFFEGLFWWIHSFRLPLFFFIAGFFAPLLLESRGPRKFLRHRIRRLLIPFLAGSLVVVPGSMVYAWSCHLVTGMAADQGFLAFLCDREVLSEVLGPMHLWFLEDLFILSMVFLVVRWLAPASWGRKPPVDVRAHRRARPYRSRALLPLMLALPTALMLGIDLNVFTAHHNSFVPDLGRLAYYGYCFAVGTLLHAHKSRLAQEFGAPWLHTAMAATATAGMLALLPFHLAGGPGHWLFAALVALQVWLSIFAVIGLALRWRHAGHPVVRYLADGSFWVYLCHLPLVAFLQLALFNVGLPAAFKFLLVVAMTMVTALLSYQVLGRRADRKAQALRALNVNRMRLRRCRGTDAAGAERKQDEAQPTIAA